MSKKTGLDLSMTMTESLQAVVLADDFTTSLNPLSGMCPSILTPVANECLLDYLVETLLQSQVTEMFLYCSSHVDQLKKYVASRNYKDITVSLIISDGCRSLGDALRDIDSKGSLRGYFILVRGDAFTNADLKSLMRRHRMRCERDKGAAMTIVFRDLGSSGISTSRDQACVFVANKTNKKVLYHKKFGKGDKSVNLELEWFLNHDQVQINSSYVDTHIYLCSPSVPMLFTDNFDFQTMEDFIKGVLMNEEILDSRIYWHPLDPEKYALPVTSWQAYHTLSHDVLQRQGYPLTPDMLPPLRNVVHMSRSTYKHRSAVLVRGCNVERDSIIGAGSVIGKKTFISGSVIGAGCTIGDNVRIENSYLLADVGVENDCKIERSVLFAGCRLAGKAHLKNCILSPGIKLPVDAVHADSILESTGAKITSTKMSEQDLESDEEFVYFDAGDRDADEDDTESAVSSSGSSSARCSPIPDDTNLFLTEVIDSLLRGYQDGLECDNLTLEINSSRYAYNISIREVTYNVVKAILSLPSFLPAEDYKDIIKSLITFFHNILLNYIKTKDAQIDCLRAIQEVASTNPKLLSCVKLLLHILYDRDIVTEEKILEWYEENAEDEEEEEAKEIVRIAVKPFISWLKEAEEASTEDEDED